FTESEWKSVWRIVTRKKLPKTPPPLVKFIPVLAELGGYNNRNSDTPPGPKPLWIAIRRMHDFAQAWEVFHTDEE
ncbi:IS4 family transposase, partial [Blastopirellula marina]